MRSLGSNSKEKRVPIYLASKKIKASIAIQETNKGAEIITKTSLKAIFIKVYLVKLPSKNLINHSTTEFFTCSRTIVIQTPNRLT